MEVIREPNLFFHKTKVPECTYDLYYNGISAYSSEILATNWNKRTENYTDLYFDIYGFKVKDIIDAINSTIETRYYKSDTIPYYYYNNKLIYKATNRDSYYDENKRRIIVFGPYINSWTRSIKAMYNKDGVIFNQKTNPRYRANSFAWFMTFRIISNWKYGIPIRAVSKEIRQTKSPIFLVILFTHSCLFSGVRDIATLSSKDKKSFKKATPPQTPSPPLLWL